MRPFFYVKLLGEKTNKPGHMGGGFERNRIVCDIWLKNDT
tara:strand:- start:241 stop:360 length:120 start_codon:yes stop_codon:yes gene_type:complete